MNAITTPPHWNVRHWLAFLLLHAADADGQRSRGELRQLHVGLGHGIVGEVERWMEGHDTSTLEAALRAGLPALLAEPGARQQMQRMLRDLFLADGTYGEEEQAMTKKIGDWLREVGE